MKRRQHIEIDGREFTVSNLDKVFFPGSGFTKGEVIRFYSEAAEFLLPHLQDRPLTLKRYPDGVTGEHFYEKNAPSHTPAWINRFAVPRGEGEGEINYVLCNDLPTLIWATNLGDIEKHVLLAKAPALNEPTSIVFDLDPGEPAGMIECGRVAIRLRDLLSALGLESFVKVSGSKGLHMSVPLNTPVTYESTQPFAKAIAELLEQQMSDAVVSDMAKKLRKGKVLIDWSQNSDFKTTVSVYAMRAKREEPFISMPIEWDELARAVKRKNERSLFFTAKAAIRRLAKVGDLFAPVLTLEQTLPAEFLSALAAGPAPRLSTWQRHRQGSKDKSLKEYAAKRDHTQTPEPPARPHAKASSKNGVHRFVIQKHAASHLHYDWRLEMEGVLRSWAVPKGPPKTPRETRLAMHVEDHPLEYEDFEGTIPPGNYGAGTVMVWDRGEYEDITGNPAAAYHQGKMHVVMRGKKLKGEWILLKDRREEPDSNKWLLIKAGTALKLSAKADDTSAVSGRSMVEIAKANDRQWQSNRETAPKVEKRRVPGRSQKRAQGAGISPHYVEPMKCLSVAELPEGDDWSFEIKFDGYRTLALKEDDKVSLLSKNNKPLTQRFPAIVQALEAIPGSFTIDGEVVALDEAGRPSFQLLQNYASGTAPTCFFAFDVLLRDGREFTGETLEERRAALADLLPEQGEVVRSSPVLNGDPAQIVSAISELNLEGVVGKRAGSKYEPGERSGSWIKYRTNLQQEFVIGGYTRGTRGFDALIVGVYQGDELHFVAKVRNGFVPRSRDAVYPKLKRLSSDDCPFVNLPETKASRWGEALTAEKMKECRWVKPHLVCQVAFLEWTDGGKLRHCSFVGLRDDKEPKDVVREL